VTSEAPLVDTTSTQLGAVVNNRSVNELPLNARDTYQFSSCSPVCNLSLGFQRRTFMVATTPEQFLSTVAAGRANNFASTAGDANEPIRLIFQTIQPTPDAIEEFRVISNTFDAEYGRNQVQVVNVITKSGTNQWHGRCLRVFPQHGFECSGIFHTIKPRKIRISSVERSVARSGRTALLLRIL